MIWWRVPIQPAFRAMRRTAGRSRWQWIWRRLHEEALVGRNFGEGDFRRSGELAALKGLRDQNPSARVVLDVGSNDGSWALAARRLWPDADIHAFEPSTATFARLAAATRDARITCVRAACSDRPGVSELHSVPGLSGLSSLHDRDLSRVRLRMTEVEEVPVITLRAYCAEQGIREVDLLKIDVEGHELAVLHGAAEILTEGRIGAIQFEFGGTNIDSRTFLRDFVDLLGDRYTIHRLLLDGLEELKYTEREEVFVATNFLAIRHANGPARREAT